MAQQITYDKAYDAVAPEDFPAMLEVPRYGRRSNAFDGIISATHDHFWDPLDKNYIDFDQPFDMATTSVVPLDMVVELRSAVGDPGHQGADDLLDHLALDAGLGTARLVAETAQRGEDFPARDPDQLRERVHPHLVGQSVEVGQYNRPTGVAGRPGRARARSPTSSCP